MVGTGGPHNPAGLPLQLSGANHAHRAQAHGGVADIQRARLVAAAVHAATERGAAEFTVASVVERAGVSRRTFYELFSDSEDCLLAAIQDAYGRARARALSAIDAALGSWREQVRAVVVALLRFFEERPDIARLLLVEWLAAGPKALELRCQAIAQLAAVVEQGRGQAPGRPVPPALAGEAVVGSVASVLHGRLIEGRAGLGQANQERAGDVPADGRPGAQRAMTARRGAPLVELTGPLMSLIVLPYLGQAAARRELARPLPAEAQRDRGQGSGRRAGEPFAVTGGTASQDDGRDRLGIRITYRTMRVLRALAVHPGASNRQVAQAADVLDQGQISKLLRRLERVGLAENRSEGALRGAANAWSLTSRGEQVERSLRI